MKFLRFGAALVLLAALAVAVQLGDPPPDSPARQFARLPEAPLLAQAQQAPLPAALFLADYIIEDNQPQRVAALALRQRLLVGASAPEARLQTAGWSSWAAAGNAFGNLAGNSLAESLQHGELVALGRPLLGSPGPFDKLRALAKLFPPVTAAIDLAELGQRTGAINEALARQLAATETLDQFRHSFMPLLELARRCRTWSEWQTLVQQADSPDQVRVLIQMVSASPAAPKQLSQVLVMAGMERAAVLDYLLRQGPGGLETLHVALRKGAAGLKLVTDNPGLTAAALRADSPATPAWQRWYQELHRAHGAIVPALKYFFIAVAAGLLLLAVVPASYFGRLMAADAEPTTASTALSALAVGAVLSGLAYVFARSFVTPATAAAAVEGGVAAAGKVAAANPLLSGAVVLLSLLTHGVVWVWVRGKLKVLEEDELSAPALRLKRLENLDVFLDLPLFCGLALTVIAFILITLDAGMSRHFAYTSTVVGILSAVSLRIRYQYPLKERLLHQ